jgi:NADPH:quinone reductase-like Zn-dependent oxidoreductase
MKIPSSQSRYELVKQTSGYSLERRTGVAIQAPAADEVIVKVRATSLNRRDIMVLRGAYPVGSRDTLVPVSDGAGEVVAIGDGVTRWQIGDRVAGVFFQTWLDGRPTASTGASALGGAQDGMLAEYVTLPAQGLIDFPSHLSFEEAATLPCAALTAWRGLFTQGRLQPGDHVLLQGTGGVSIFGLQFAAAAGAKAIITSSSDSKLERARKLGATATLNYRQQPEWAENVRKVTDGVGAHHILEVGGAGTLKQSLAALASGGHIAIIGGLSGFGGDIPAVSLIGRSASVSGIFVGSKADFVQMNAFITEHRIRPVVDRVFGFDEADSAYVYMDSGSHFGKIVIRH